MTKRVRRSAGRVHDRWGTELPIGAVTTDGSASVASAGRQQISQICSAVCCYSDARSHSRNVLDVLADNVGEEPRSGEDDERILVVSRVGSSELVKELGVVV